MAEEPVAQPRAFMRAFDQAGNIGEHELTTARADHAELRMQRGEGIVGDLRPCRADRGEESGFAGIGQADETGVGDQLEPQPDPALFASLAGIGMAWRAIGRRLEMRVAEAAIAACREHEFLAELGEIVDRRVEPVDGLDDDVAAAAAIAARWSAELDELLAPERDAAVAAVAGADVDL